MEEASPKAVVVVPTYNERENLPVLVGLLEDLQLANLHILVVDDNSPDGTGRWCDDMHERDPRLNCLHRSGKLGLGTAILEIGRAHV